VLLLVVVVPPRLPCLPGDQVLPPWAEAQTWGASRQLLRHGGHAARG
jgi:hypothetical protein